MIVSFTFIQNDCFLCQSIQKEKKLSKDENTEDIILPTPSSPPPQKKPQMIWSCKALAILIYVYFIYIVLPWFRNF